MNTLSIDRLSLVYPKGTRALDCISLHIENGMFGLLGPNGAGKSSLMKILATLQQPTAGRVLYNGTNIVRDSAGIKKKLGFLPQDFGVYPRVSAYNLLQHLAILKGVCDAQERKRQICGLLEKVNLTSFKNKDVYTFSGGMKQRFGVAQALLGRPEILIVDEPTAGLDPEERNRFNALLSDISEEMIVILSTHLVEDVRNLCSQVAIIDKGRLIGSGKPSEMISALKGKVWTKKIDKKLLSEYEHNYPVISCRYIERALHITTFGNRPPEGFSPVKPTLEHVYFRALKEPHTL